jgi:SAM-dependent methyltransferase
MKTLPMPLCPACHGRSFRYFDLGGGNQLRRCVTCDTVSAESYVDPSEVYVDGYMFGQAGPFGVDVRDPVYQRYLARVADRRIAMIEKAAHLSRGSLLDVGSGTGEVLAAARDRGWSVQGVEPERTGAQVAQERGLDVAVSTLEESGLPMGSFDVVSAFHVLEHLADSQAFLRTLAQWVRPGGAVVIEVPNWRSVQRRRLHQRWSGLRPGEHLVHFTPQTLARTMRTSGVQPVQVWSPAYVGPPQNLDQALWDLQRPLGRLSRVLRRLSRVETIDGVPTLYPTPAGWSILRVVEAVYDAAGVGAVVFCVGRV